MAVWSLNWTQTEHKNSKIKLPQWKVVQRRVLEIYLSNQETEWSGFLWIYKCLDSCIKKQCQLQKWNRIQDRFYPDEANAFSKVAMHAAMWEVKAQLETYCNDIKRKGILGKKNWEARERESRLQKFYFSQKVYLLKIAATPNHAYIQPPP